MHSGEREYKMLSELQAWFVVALYQWVQSHNYDCILLVRNCPFIRRILYSFSSFVVLADSLRCALSSNLHVQSIATLLSYIHRNSYDPPRLQTNARSPSPIFMLMSILLVILSVPFVSSRTDHGTFTLG